MYELHLVRKGLSLRHRVRGRYIQSVMAIPNRDIVGFMGEVYYRQV